MTIIGRDVLERLLIYHDTKSRVSSWTQEVENAEWKDPHDVKKLYGSASFPGNQMVVFNIKGNKYRIIATIDYESGIVMIKWAGTHQEYNKQNKDNKLGLRR